MYIKIKDMNIDLLHQVDPHLWVDEILEDRLSRIVTLKRVDPGHPTIRAHFPGAPVVPGSILQEMATQSAALLLSKHHVEASSLPELAIGVLMRVHDARYRGFVRPPATCRTTVDLESRASSAYRFRAEVATEEVVARFHFTLANLPMGELHPDAPNFNSKEMP